MAKIIRSETIEGLRAIQYDLEKWGYVPIGNVRFHNDVFLPVYEQIMLRVSERNPYGQSGPGCYYGSASW